MIALAPMASANDARGANSPSLGNHCAGLRFVMKERSAVYRCVRRRGVSIGDFGLSGGEIAAMAVIDASSATAGRVEDGFGFVVVLPVCSMPTLQAPESWRGIGVPHVLLSGHHAQIAEWRRREALAATARQRPDLIDRARVAGQLSAADERQLRSPVEVAPK